MKIRYLADADLKVQIGLTLQRSEPAIDFQTANEAGLTGLKDPQVLAYAAGKIVVIAVAGTFALWRPR